MRGILNEGCYILGVMKITLITPHLWMWKMSFFGRDISRGRGGGSVSNCRMFRIAFQWGVYNIAGLVKGGHQPVEFGYINAVGHIGDHGFIGGVADERR